MAAVAALSNQAMHPSAAGFAAAASYAGGKPVTISPDALLSKALSTKVNGNAVVTGSGEADESKATQFDGCATCKTRKYVDRSNENDVSFQSASHISPSASAAVVSSHEREHVANAVQKASKPGAKLVSATVRLITSVCPECGRRYVAGGVTNTLIRYSKNPYSQNQRKVNDGLLRGNNVDFKL